MAVNMLLYVIAYNECDVVMERAGGDSLLIMFPHFTTKYTECANLF